VEKYLPEFKGQMLLASKDADTVTLKNPPGHHAKRLAYPHRRSAGISQGVSNLIRKQDHTLGKPLQFRRSGRSILAGQQMDVLVGWHARWAISFESGFRPTVRRFFSMKRFFAPLGRTIPAFISPQVKRNGLAELCAIKRDKLIRCQCGTDSRAAKSNGDADLPARPWP